MSDPAKRVRDFIAKVNKTYKGGIVEVGGKFTALKVARFSSGILDLDVALGGGWPFSRIAILAGEYSSGKTWVAIQAAAQIENYDHTTKRHKDFCGDEFEPGTTLIVDAEGTFDMEWAKSIGFNDELHVVARPEHSEQVIDIVTTAIVENVFDLIIIDSIAAMTPIKEIEESSEKWQMGLAARLNNKAFRRWNSQLNRLTTDGKCGPTLICINQFRMKIGIMFGDPRTLPGGKGQEFNSAIIMYMKNADYSDGKEHELERTGISGVVWKNKTYIPRMNFKAEMLSKDIPPFRKGQVDNVKRLMHYGKKFKLIKVGKAVTFGTTEFRTQAEMINRLKVSPVLTRQLWRSIVKAGTDQIV